MKKKSKPKPTVTEQLRESVREAGSQSEVSRESGVPQPRLSVFLAGGGLNSRHFDRLATYCRLELRKR